MTFGPLVDKEWLRAHLGDPGVAVVDTRWRLGEPGAGERDYLVGHVPGAAFLDVDRDLSAEPGESGRHPLPTAEGFEAAARRAGIGRGAVVIAYDEAAEGGAARLWWLLRHFGHERVAVLDGGLRAWRQAGGSLRAGREDMQPGDLEASPRQDDTVGAEELRARLGDAALALLDARAAQRYRGDDEPLDPVAGHIPAAANVPFAELAPGGRFLPAAELQARLDAASRRDRGDTVAYCGSGITASVLVLSAVAAGLPAPRLYPGSWSEWSRRGLPVETGDRR